VVSKGGTAHKRDWIWGGLALAVMAIFLGGDVLIWFGLVPSSSLPFVFLIALPFQLVGLAYLSLYAKKRQKQSSNLGESV